MREVFLGIDGGGTKTAFVLEVNKKLYEHKEKTIHLKQISRDEFFKRLKNGIEILVKKAGIEISDIDFTFLAMRNLRKMNLLFLKVLKKFWDQKISKLEMIV